VKATVLIVKDILDNWESGVARNTELNRRKRIGEIRERKKGEKGNDVLKFESESKQEKTKPTSHSTIRDDPNRKPHISSYPPHSKSYKSNNSNHQSSPAFSFQQLPNRKLEPSERQRVSSPSPFRMLHTCLARLYSSTYKSYIPIHLRCCWVASSQPHPSRRL